MAYMCYFACDECGIEGGAWCNKTVSLTKAIKIAKKHKWKITDSGSWLCPECAAMKKFHKQTSVKPKGGTTLTYRIYFYDNTYYRDKNEYGYWTGKNYSVNKLVTPICEKTPENAKTFTSLKRCINSADSVYSKCEFVMAIDIEDSNGDVVYSTRRS